MTEVKYESLQRLCSPSDEKTWKQELRKEYQPYMDRSQGTYIWGTGLLGRFALKQLKQSNLFGEAAAFIDNNEAMAGTVIDGIPVISPDMAETNYLIVICSYFFMDIEKQIKSKMSNPSLHYRVLPYLDDNIQEWDMFGTINKLDIYRENYKKIFTKCADEVSREVLDCILNYRFTMKSEWIQKAYDVTNDNGTGIEYFDAGVIKPQENEVYVDCGGYIGDTVLGFLEFADSGYKKIYYFEPSEGLYHKGKENLKGVHNIALKNTGVGEKAGVMRFAGEGDSGHIDEHGTETVSIVTLDEVVAEQPTLIKMDIEGAELSALKGASKLIKESKPKLAICVYHKPEDLFEILELIDSWGIHYKYYFRHYNRGIAGTILYCIPQGE